jgi:hypothetical protein
MGLAGFRERPTQDDDPLVCACGATLGALRLEKPENAYRLAEVLAAHQPEHLRRLAVQARARGYAAPAVPPDGEEGWRHEPPEGG